MTTSANALLGIVFLVLAFATTFSMYQFWGYPYDKEKRRSACPQWKMNIHRALGFAYGAIYIVLMIQMVPRLWSYQVEFPARTVAHIVFGLSIGVILIVKISILRFFRHFEEWMPVLGTLLLLFTVLLAGLSLPFVFEEHVLAQSASGQDLMSRENRARAERQLQRIDFGREVDIAELASRKSMLAGREVLLSKCVYCHDLKTAIAKPRTSSDWWRTVARMASKPSLGEPMTPHDQLVVTAYLVAITPDLQSSVVEKQKRDRRIERTAKFMVEAATEPSIPPAQATNVEFDAKQASDDFEDLCSQCHDLSDVDDAPPSDREEAREILRRMIENGMEAEEDQLGRIEEYMVRKYVND